MPLQPRSCTSTLQPSCWRKSKQTCSCCRIVNMECLGFMKQWVVPWTWLPMCRFTCLEWFWHILHLRLLPCEWWLLGVVSSSWSRDHDTNKTDCVVVGVRYAQWTHIRRWRWCERLLLQRDVPAPRSTLVANAPTNKSTIRTKEHKYIKNILVRVLKSFE